MTRLYVRMTKLYVRMGKHLPEKLIHEVPAVLLCLHLPKLPHSSSADSVKLPSVSKVNSVRGN